MKKLSIDKTVRFHKDEESIPIQKSTAESFVIFQKFSQCPSRTHARQNKLNENLQKIQFKTSAPLFTSKCRYRYKNLFKSAILLRDKKTLLLKKYKSIKKSHQIKFRSTIDCDQEVCVP